MNKTTDALGNEIIVGNKYGYSRNQNGFTYVRIGDIVKINDKSVRMKVESSKRQLYDGILENDNRQKAQFINIKSIMLFPV